VELSESGAQQFRHLYEDSIPLWEKVNTIAKSMYGASEIVADKIVREQFKAFELAGYGNFPICMAKTQYSFSTDPNLKGAPSGHVVQIREIRLSAGAEFIVVVTGEIMTMPGLPKQPAASTIELDARGFVIGLF
jgi:formate--tetrahydrofolate ligase